MKIESYKNFDSINENLAKARSVLRSLEIPETNEDFLELRKMLSRNAGYLGKFTEWHFKDKVELQQLRNLYTRIRGARLSKPIDQFESPEEIIDTIIRSDAEAAVNQMIGAIPSRTRDFLKHSGYCPECDSDQEVTCDKCDGDCSVECKKCDGEGCKKCDDEGSIGCEACKAEGTVICPACKDGTKDWKEFVNFLKLQKDKKEIIIDLFSKKGGRYEDYESDEVLDSIKRDIERLLNTQSIDQIKEKSINSQKVMVDKGEKWNSKTKRYESIKEEEKAIQYLFDNDKYLIIATNWEGLQYYGSSYWCITEDEDTFNSYVYEDGYNLQLILYIKGKTPLIDDRSVMGITYNLDNKVVAAAHWEDDSECERAATAILKEIGFINLETLFSCLDLYDGYEDSDTLVFIFPNNFKGRIEKIIDDSISEKNKIKDRKRDYNKLYGISSLLSNYSDHIFEYGDGEVKDTSFIVMLKSLLNKKGYKFPVENVNDAIIFSMIDEVEFNKSFLREDIFEIIDDYRDTMEKLDPEAVKKTINYFKNHGYKFTDLLDDRYFNNYIDILLETGVLTIQQVYQKIDWLDTHRINKIKPEIRNSLFNYVLDNDFLFITTNNNIAKFFIDYIISNNLVERYKTDIIKNLQELKFSINTADYILDKIEDDEIDIAAARRLIHQKIHKKYQIDFKKFEGMRYLKSYKVFESDKENLSKNYFEDKINHDLIQSLKDISLDLFDEYEDLQLVYNVTTNYTIINNIGHRLLHGFFRTKNEKLPDNLSDFERDFITRRNLAVPMEYEHWTNFHQHHLDQAIEEYEAGGTHPLIYRFAFYKGEPRTETFKVLSEEEHKEILNRLRKMYPKERIEIQKF